MGVDQIIETGFENVKCPRLMGECGRGGRGCPALESLEMPPGSAGHLEASVQALMGCRSFLWDVLTDGEWTGCARRELRTLKTLYGVEALSTAFGE